MEQLSWCEHYYIYCSHKPAAHSAIPCGRRGQILFCTGCNIWADLLLAIGPDNVMLSSGFSRRATRRRPLMLIAWRLMGLTWVMPIAGLTAGLTGGRLH